MFSRANGFVYLLGLTRFFSFSEGANGDGMAVISSLRSFDREQQKEYLIPIVIKDSGNPAMTGTSTLTVIIRDVNDNKMQPGSKEIFAYNYMVNNGFRLCFLATKCTASQRRLPDCRILWVVFWVKYLKYIVLNYFQVFRIRLRYRFFRIIHTVF